MSAETLQALEDAIRAHFEDALDDEASPQRRAAVIVDWVCAFTISNVVEVDNKTIVAFRNELVSPDTNPNAQAHLALWAHHELADVLTYTGEE